MGSSIGGFVGEGVGAFFSLFSFFFFFSFFSFLEAFFFSAGAGRAAGRAGDGASTRSYTSASGSVCELRTAVSFSNSSFFSNSSATRAVSDDTAAAAAAAAALLVYNEKIPTGSLGCGATVGAGSASVSAALAARLSSLDPNAAAANASILSWLIFPVSYGASTSSVGRCLASLASNLRCAEDPCASQSSGFGTCSSFGSTVWVPGRPVLTPKSRGRGIGGCLSGDVAGTSDFDF